MGKRLSDLQKLAREICWVGFSREGQKGKTRASYWNSLPEETRLNYVRDARWFVYVLEKIDIDMLNMAHDMTATPPATQGG